MSKISSKFDCLVVFKKNLIEFLDALMELLPQEKDLITLRVMFESKIPIEMAMDIFYQRIIPYRKMVEQKDERFFLEATDLFSGIQKNKVSYFKDLWQSSNLTDDDRQTLWRWFSLFLKIALKYETFSN